MNLKKQQRQRGALARRLKDVDAWNEMARKTATKDKAGEERRARYLAKAAQAQRECDILKSRIHVS